LHREKNRHQFFSCFIILSGISQILDDSTKQIYGYTTTKFTTEDEIYSGRNTFFTIDTTINDLHRYYYTYKPKQSYQDLGVLGSAAKPIFWEQSKEIGIRSGMNGFDIYAPNPKKIKYYNTKSPFSELYYVQCRGCEEILTGEISRNINKNANVGIKYTRFNSLKQIGSTGNNRVNKYADHNSLVLYTSINSKNDRYKLLANYTHFNHYTLDNGGIRPISGDSAFRDQLIQYQLTKVNLTNAKTWERRNSWHLYHQYDILKNGKLTVFHVADRFIKRIFIGTIKLIIH
jgi:hypothetical protein